MKTLKIELSDFENPISQIPDFPSKTKLLSLVKKSSENELKLFVAILKEIKKSKIKAVQLFLSIQRLKITKTP